MTTVSIITATLNRPSLKDACKSVDNQTVHDWHHYVIGDGLLPIDYTHPNRTTIGFTRPIGADEPGVNMPDGTPNPILRWGLEHLMLGDFVCFLDDDNIYKPEFLEVMLNALRANPVVGISICAMEDLRYGQNLDGYPELKRCDNSGFLVHSRFAKKIVYPRATPERSVNQDYEFIKQCADLYGWVRVPQQLTVFGIHPNTPSLRGHTKTVFSWALPVSGVQMARLGLYKEAVQAFIKAIEIDAQDAWALWHLGEVYFMMGCPTEGMLAWKRWFKLIQLDKKMPHDWLQYCYALVSGLEGDSIGAKATLTDAIQRVRNRIKKDDYELEDIMNLALYSLLSDHKDVARHYYANIVTQHRLDKKDVDDMIWDLRVLQATGLKIDGISEMLQIVQG